MDLIFYRTSGERGTRKVSERFLQTRRDLDTARKKWIAEAETVSEQADREQSDFLYYCNSKGKYADFHRLRHTFSSDLGKAGVPPKTAQILARHSDTSLTLNIYTHVDHTERFDAIHSLPGLRRQYFSTVTFQKETSFVDSRRWTEFLTQVKIAQ
ncbi:MAG: tyrosine-type recombinase/integrase [Thermoguttaceae bacterium]